MPENEVLTLWVRLKDRDRERAVTMRDQERRTFASLLRVALDLYYETHYTNAEK